MDMAKRVILVFLGILLVASMGFAVNLAVNGTGAGDSAACVIGSGIQQNFTTIQAAVAVANHSDIIYICKNGSTGYVETITVNKSLNFFGNESNLVIIAANTSRPAITVSNTVANTSNFTNLSISSGSVGIHFNNATGARLYNVTITRNVIGILIENSNTTSIFESTIYNNTNGGIYFNASTAGGSASNSIYNNTIHNHSVGVAAGIYMTGVNRRNMIYNNTLIENNTYGIYLSTSNYTVMEDNKFTTNTYGAYLSSANYNNLTRNNASGSTVGYYLTASTFNKFERDDAWYNTGSGYQLFSTSNNNIFNRSHAYSNGVYGFYLESSHNNNLTTNTGFNNTKASFVLNLTLGSNLDFNNASAQGTAGFGAYTVVGSGAVNMTSNNATHNVNAYYFNNVSMADFVKNNVTNATTYGFYLASSATFALNQTMYFKSMPNSSVEFYIYNTNFNTATYNVTSDVLEFGLNTTNNVSVKAVNFTALGVSGISEIVGYTITSAGILNHTTNDWLGIRVATISGVPYVSPILYYNIPLYYNATQGNYTLFGLGKATAGFNWNFVDSSTNGTPKVMYVGYTTPFDQPYIYFAPIGMNGSVTVATVVPQSSGTSQPSTAPVVTEEAVTEEVPVEEAVTTTPPTTPPAVTEEETIPPAEEGVIEEVVEEVVAEEQKAEAETVISSAGSSITSAEAEGKDVEAAKQKLEEANAALAEGNYEEAEQLALEAEELAKAAKAAPTGEEGAGAAGEEKLPATPAAKGLDLGSLLLIVGVIVVVLLAIYYFTKMKGGGGYKFKGHRHV